VTSVPANGDPAGDRPARGRPAPTAPEDDDEPLRVTSLELFFDLVFAFTLTQLAALLAGNLTLTGTAQVLLIFGLLWWMYEGYAWLTNARPPVHTAERLLLLVSMAGFLTIGLAIPNHGFGGSGLALGLGYLLVVLVHGWLYYRVNRNILRIVPFNILSALLVITASLLPGPAQSPAVYALWILALAVQLASPLIVRPRNLFGLRAAHLTERHGALLLVALGESVVSIGVGAEELVGRTGQENARVVAAAVLGLALAAALWWIIFAGGDQERAEQILTAATSERRTSLALSALFYANIPLLLGVVAISAGVRQAIGHAARLEPGPARAAVALAVGAALFLAGDVVSRRLLRLGPVRLRIGTAVLMLATAAIGATVSLEVQLAVVTAALVLMLLLERYWPTAGVAAG
jgi:low temperature requirement protein LtrA